MFPVFTTKDTMTTTKVPRRGRHGNTDIAFSSENFLARAGPVRARDYNNNNNNIILSTVATRMRTGLYTLSHQTILFGDVLRCRVCVRPATQR